MKRIYAVLLVLALVCMGAVTALAAGETTEINQTGQSGATDITLTAEFPDPTYTLIIPAKIDFGTREISKTSSVVTQSFSVGFSNLSFFNGKMLYVSVAGNGTDGAFTLTGSSTGDVVPYTVACGEEAIASGGTIAVVDDSVSSDEYACSLSVDMANVVKKDAYSGQLLFHVELK